MQIQRINTYNNKYSSNGSQKTNSSNSTFGHKLEVVFDSETAMQLGKVECEGILDVVKLWLGNLSLAAKAKKLQKDNPRLSHYVKTSRPNNLNRLATQLNLTVRATTKGIHAWVQDLKSTDFSSFTESSRCNSSEAVTEALTGALDGWLEIRLARTAIGRRKPRVILAGATE